VQGASYYILQVYHNFIDSNNTAEQRTCQVLAYKDKIHAMWVESKGRGENPLYGVPICSYPFLLVPSMEARQNPFYTLVPLHPLLTLLAFFPSSLYASLNSCVRRSPAQNTGT